MIAQLFSRTIRTAALVAVLAAVTTPVAETASAQDWRANFVGVGEVDTEGTVFVLGSVSTGPRGRGFNPRLGLHAHYISYDVGTTNRSVTVLKPFVGLRNSFAGGSAGVNVGYAFSSRRDEPVVGAVLTEQGEGIVVSGGVDYWGTGTPWGYQLLGSYNARRESIWSRARATRQLRRSGSGQTRLGAEVAFLSGESFTAFQPGALLEIHNNGRIFAFGAGMKLINPESGPSGDAVYFKVETVLPLLR